MSLCHIIQMESFPNYEEISENYYIYKRKSKKVDALKIAFKLRKLFR